MKLIDLSTDREKHKYFNYIHTITTYTYYCYFTLMQRINKYKLFLRKNTLKHNTYY